MLYPGDPANYYDEFRLCPSEALRQKLNQAEVLIENWHTLMPLKEQTRSVVRKGSESDEAFTRRVLGKLSGFRDIVVINDEAHHAYRVPPEAKVGKKRAAELGLDLDEATRWIEGLDRIHKTRRIRRCFDLSATPFAPTGKRTTETALFEWIVSDFGLNDAIEAGLVKTPRIVVRDDAIPDAKTLKPKLYHIYRDPSVSQDLNRPAQPHEPMPKLVQDAYTVYYLWQGSRRRYLPDFLVRLTNGKTLVLEIKGQDSAQNRAKREALGEWIAAVNSMGGFGTWCWDVAFAPAAVHDILAKHVA